MKIPGTVMQVLNWIRPQAAEDRRPEHRADNGGGYNGGRLGIRGMSDWNPLGTSGNAAVMRNRSQIINRSRDLVRNAPIARAAVNKRVGRVVGTGLSYHSRIDYKALGMTESQAQEWQEIAEREFGFAAARCDITAEADFYELSDLAFRTTLQSGDGLVSFPRVKKPGDVYETKIQIIEGDRVCNPDGVQNRPGLEAGTEMDEYGAVTAYWVLNQHPGNLLAGLPKRWQRVPAVASTTGRRVAKLLYFRERPGQYRGIPMVAPLIEPLQKLDKFADSTLMNAIVSSLFTVFLESQDGEPISGLPGNDENEDKDAPTTERELRMGAGAFVELPKGTTPKFGQPSNPNPSFDGFFQAFVNQIAMALEEPPETLVGAYKSSYSASRAALLDLWTVIRRNRAWLVSNFCQLFLEAWMDEAVSIGRINAPGYFEDPAIRMAYLGAEWVGDAPPSLDPLKEAEAAVLKVEKNLSTHAAEIAAMSGNSWSSVLRQRAREQKEIESAGLLPPPQPGAAAPQAPAKNADKKSEGGNGNTSNDTEGDETE